GGICKMNVILPLRMTVDEYLVWADGRPGRYELMDGAVCEMAPETAGHAKIKAAVYVALMNAIRRRQLPCYALPDGMTVRIDDKTAYQPDALVYCGKEIDPALVEVRNPVIVVEVLSRSTREVDLSVKLPGYFRVPSVAHYLIADPVERLV